VVQERNAVAVERESARETAAQREIVPEAGAKAIEGVETREAQELVALGRVHVANDGVRFGT
jgi:hypothetical protein